MPPGDNILCACKREIDLTSGKEVDVTPPGDPQPGVGGGMWFLKRLWKRPPPPPKRKTRRQVSCSECQVKRGRKRGEGRWEGREEAGSQLAPEQWIYTCMGSL